MDAHASSLVSNSSVSARMCFRHRRVGLGMSVQRVVQTTGSLHMLHKCGGDLGMGSLCSRCVVFASRFVGPVGIICVGCVAFFT